MAKNSGRRPGRPRKNENELPIKPPKYLKGEAYNLFRRLRDPLTENKLLNNLDQSLLESFCMQYQIIRESYAVIAEFGPVKATTEVTIIDKGNSVKKIIKETDFDKNPAVTALGNATKEFRQIADQLGLSPKSREEILKSAKSDDEDGNKPKSNIISLIKGSGTDG
ncbi:phage terminase small subunit P27 family [Fructilactobacillus myrtifloralis]|uniref:Phage terminase small subunit P27 family n=1 Tax=Fructilactobacillus myrtifloralis TaxID=2940301 RepID=A0ABY5BPT5_9LACO|nr:phage terminase small subunit P27 family [Fructilactobacillus myrtifloralis]USS85073.1 phage terminase small subunit P27 family [Fructilactobacillus myrtifloralis]